MEGLFLTAALYKFVALDDPASLRDPLIEFCSHAAVKGTLLLASEGINGTIAGPEDGVRRVLAFLRTDPRFADLEHKESWSTTPPFHRLKIKLKREIVTLGVPGVSPTKSAGTYVRAADWNALISDSDVVVIDTRNDYETRVGTFAGAIDPGVKTFGELPAWIAEHEALWLRPDGSRPKVAMFCTGGIRCEKSTAYLRDQGYQEVFHLQGGILKYLEETSPAESLWQGECFFFDERVSVGHGLVPGDVELCRACREPVTAADRNHPDYEIGISCPQCAELAIGSRRARLVERQRQVRLAAERGANHVGVVRHSSARTEALPVVEDPVGSLLSLAHQAHGGERLLVGLIGMPGSGKSTRADQWRAQLGEDSRPHGEVAVLGMDGFHLSVAELAQLPDPQGGLARRGAPWTFDFAALRDALVRLKRGEVVDWPGFDHGLGDPIAGHLTIETDTKVVLVEGLYLAHREHGWALGDLFDHLWYLDVPTSVARERTIARHQLANANSPEEALDRWRNNDKHNAKLVRRTARRAHARII